MLKKNDKDGKKQKALDSWAKEFDIWLQMFFTVDGEQLTHYKMDSISKKVRDKLPSYVSEKIALTDLPLEVQTSAPLIVEYIKAYFSTDDIRTLTDTVKNFVNFSIVRATSVKDFFVDFQTALNHCHAALEDKLPDRFVTCIAFYAAEKSMPEEKAE